MSAPLRLWSWSASPFAGKVRAACAEKGVEVQLLEIHPVRRPGRLTELNPLGRVPVLELPHVALRESSAILEWLEERYPEPALWPADVDLRAWGRGWARWIDDVLLVNFFLSMRKQAFGRSEDDPQDIVERMQGRLTSAWPLLDELLGIHAGPWLLGEQFTLADLAGLPLAVRLPQWAPQLAPERWPAAAAWLASLRERPSAAAIEQAGTERLEG